MRETEADLGLAFDGDADRCFVVDERGEAAAPSAVTALIAARLLAGHPGSTVLHYLITSRTVPDVVREHGGTPVRTRDHRHSAPAENRNRSSPGPRSPL